MSPLDELAGWAAANEDRLRAFVAQLDELVADGVPAACELAEEFRVAKAAAWDECWRAAVGLDFSPLVPNPYEPEAVESDGS